MRGHAVVGEQGVQEKAQNAHLWGPSVEDQRGGDVVTYLHHLGMARQEVQDPVAQGRVQTQVPELNDDLGGCLVLHTLYKIIKCSTTGYFLTKLFIS